MRWAFLFVSLLIGAQAFGIDFQKINDELQSRDGLVAYVHGADTDHNLFVLVVRQKDFFDFVQLPMVGKNQKVKDEIAKVKRHDSVRVKGEFNDFLDAAQRHIKEKEH